MKIMNDRFYISTIAEDDCSIARKYGLGLEIAEYCTASNMDLDFSVYDPVVKRKMMSSQRFIMHAPFNELYPAAIDPLAKELAMRRYEQAVAIAFGYGINRIVVHSGYIPIIYYKSWFQKHSVEFWKRFLDGKPENLQIYLENVLEDEPELLVSVVRLVDDPRFRLCLDIGHANTCVTKVTLNEWIDCTAPYLAHVHLHNNNGDKDLHNPLGDGTIPMLEVLHDIMCISPNITFTIENTSAELSVRWLSENGLLYGGD